MRLGGARFNDMGSYSFKLILSVRMLSEVTDKGLGATATFASGFATPTNIGVIKAALMPGHPFCIQNDRRNIK